MTMTLIRMLALTGFAFLAAGISRADVPPCTDLTCFTVNLDNTGSDPSGVGAWGSDQPFTIAIDVIQPDLSTYSQNSICTDANGNPTPCGDPGDANIHVNPGGDAGALANFSADPSGGGTIGYDVPPPFNILITTTYGDGVGNDNPLSIVESTELVCSSDYYSYCGFNISDAPNTIDTVRIFYGNPVPEPSHGVLFLAATGLLIWAGKKQLSKRACEGKR
jgi:hypothetical protein